ncbi:hypothetical protein [Nocardioides sp.]|uniref:hypothetical protein n=1 Tax=Nocardioides sp. TaxID=35761 RepID=UPI003783BE39
MTVMEEVRRTADAESQEDAARRRPVGRTQQVADLMVRRPDLYGVSKLADVTTDAVLWSV